jgi:hypothetical protein
MSRKKKNRVQGFQGVQWPAPGGEQHYDPPEPRSKVPLVLFLILIVVCAAGYGITTLVQARMAETQRLVQGLPAEWRPLYAAMDAVSGGKEAEIANEFIRTNKADLDNSPPLTQENVTALLRASGMTDDTPIVKALMPFMVGPHSARATTTAPASQTAQK